MALEGLLLHHVEVYARIADEQGKQKRDRFGQPLSVNPRQHEVGGEYLVATYPCRSYMKTGGLLMEDRMVDVFQRVYMMYTELGALIYEDDAVRVLDANGKVLINLAKVQDSETKYDGIGPHHKEFTLWEQAGPNPKRVT